MEELEGFILELT